jgi:hypothetical protein
MWQPCAMAKFLLSLVLGLIAGLIATWWWLGGSPRTLNQPSERLFAWIEVASAEQLPVDAGGKPWIVGCTVHLRNFTTATTSVTVPAQRFLLVLADGSTVVGHLSQPTSVSVGEQQTASVALPKVSFFSRSQDAASVILALDEGDGLRLVAAPVGDAPVKPKEEKTEEKQPEKKEP